jgi:hypothetical protein
MIPMNEWIPDEVLKKYEPGYVPPRPEPKSNPQPADARSTQPDDAPAEQEGGGDGMLLDDGAMRVPPGRYEGVYERHETRPAYKDWDAKLVVYFRIITPGPAEGAVLPRNYNVRTVIGKPRKSGSFAVGRKSMYYREFCLLAGPPKRHDRLSPIAFLGKTVWLEVADVEHDGDKNVIVSDARYSVVRQIIGET